jgi:hypothetical protein
VYHRDVRARRGLAWVSGAAGAVGLYRFARRVRGREPAAARRQADVDTRASELRRKLDESRAVVGEREEFEAGETTVDRAEPAADVRERRRNVHAEGRAAVNEMRERAGDEAAPQDATESDPRPL